MKKTRLTLLLLIIAIVTNLIGGCSNVPKEMVPLCERYKIYYYPRIKAYIFKMRSDNIGAYIVYKYSENSYYCKMNVGLNNQDFMYYGDSYPTVERALEALELGLYGNMVLDYDDNLDIHYQGINKYGIKKKSKVICE